MESFSQGYTAWEHIRFVVVHMIQMELLVVLLSTALAAWWLSTVLKKQNNRVGEQLLSRNIAAAYTSMLLASWLAGRVFR
ncbi:hypothetical protein SCACP_03390 [Sporomusa carbonis]|uniref:hypothetical protein n=1 Tax=Sporomusa carbonis TaxID=3076075 RepID=UPI003A60C37B